MTRRALIDEIAEETGLPKGTVGQVLQTLIRTLCRAALEGERITLTGFGSFERTWRPPRKGRHPGTGRPYVAEPRFDLRFKASAPLRQRLKMLISPPSSLEAGGEIGLRRPTGQERRGEGAQG